MTMPDTASVPITVDSFGLTDKGRVRETNQDNFLIVAIRKAVDVRQSSLSPESLGNKFGAADAHLFVVADGVGGGPDGDRASESVVSALLAYVAETAGCYQKLTTSGEHELFERLEETVREVHGKLISDKGSRRSQAPATTLTMVLLAWPRAYFIHVGDSRAYVRRRGRLQRLTRDQTFGEYMVSLGAWTEEQAAGSKPAATLSSAVGGPDLSPVVGLVDLEPGDSILLCTDGLTGHLDDERIAVVLDQPAGAEVMSRQLVDEALAAGGRDNVAVIVVRSLPAP